MKGRRYWLGKISEQTGEEIDSLSALREYLKREWKYSPLSLGMVQQLENVACDLGVEEACYRACTGGMGKATENDIMDILAYYIESGNQAETARKYGLSRERVRQYVNDCLP